MPLPSIPPDLSLALQHHQAGRLQQAEQIYRQVLAQQPQHPDALHLLGVLAAQTGRNDLALDLIRQAIVLEPNYPEAHCNLGKALRAAGQLEAALAAYQQAIALQPDYAEAHNNLANALRDMGRLDEALSAYRQAIVIQPNYAEAHSNLGNALREKGQLDAALAACRQALALQPHFPQAHYNLGNVLRDQGQLDEALTAYRMAISLQPNYAEAYGNLGNTLKAKGQLPEAVAAYRQALALNPNLPETHNNLGLVLKDLGQWDEALVACRRAIALNPALPAAHHSLGSTLRDKGQLDEALAAFHQAIALDPSSAAAHNDLGNALRDAGQLDASLAAFRQALALNPDLLEAHSNLLTTLHLHPRFDASAIAAEHRRWNQQHAEPLRHSLPPHPNDRNPDRPLRIGYISPDFRDHVVGRNILPLFRHHDRPQFDITCYAQVSRPDSVTAQFQQLAGSWRNIVGCSDEQVARQIRADRIDLLIDLALHTANNRLLVFARKPAPVQVTFAGYPGSTGLTTIDYRLSDPSLDPPGMDESIYSEQTIRLPDSFWCYDPLDCHDIPVNPLPALSNRFITFGCLNNFCKINEETLALWAQVLRAVKKSRLLLLSHQGSHRQLATDLLARQAISPERIEFVDFRPRRAYLELYHRIDIGLDSLPYNGHTTSLDSFWMGVPVVTLVGQTVVGRAGLCQLTNLNLSELAVRTPDQFVQIAATLAGDLQRLAHLRSSLRSRMQSSPLMDAPRFARNIETAYRRMWRHWCVQTPAMPIAHHRVGGTSGSP